MLEYVILPLVSFASGLASLFIDPRKDKAKAWVLILALLASVTATGVFGYIDGQEQKRRADAEQSKLDKVLAALASQGRLPEVQHALQGQGILNVTTSAQLDLGRVKASLAADAARQRVLQSTLQNRSAQHPVIEYFTKDIDNDAVINALKEGGFEFKQVGAQIPDPTNAIWVGDSVPLSDVKFVALTLIRAGVQLHAIRRFRDGSGPKSNLIQIGADRALNNAPVLTVDQIQNMSSLPPRAANDAAGG